MFGAGALCFALGATAVLGSSFGGCSACACRFCRWTRSEAPSLVFRRAASQATAPGRRHARVPTRMPFQRRAFEKVASSAADGAATVVEL